MQNPKVSIVAALAGKKRVLGYKGTIPWYIPEDLQRFKAITMGAPIIMGRRTFESIGRILPGRINIVITRDTSFKREGITIVHSLEEALQQVQNHDEVFVIGGGEIYNQALPITDKLYLTIIDKEIEGDTFFPDFQEFKKVIWQSEEQESDGLKYKFLELER